MGREWTLDDLADRAGVSRATLSRIEKGEVSPTTEVLSRIAAAHGLAMSRLLMMVEEGVVAHVPLDAQPLWLDGETGFSRRMVSPPHPALSAEILECRLAPGAQVHYDLGPALGKEHHLVLLDGGLTMDIGGTTHRLAVGDCLRYRLEGPNTFRADPEQGVRYLLVLVQGA
jgi:transcriptional regulator with XRE-family HTH domain